MLMSPSLLKACGRRAKRSHAKCWVPWWLAAAILLVLLMVVLALFKCAESAQRALEADVDYAITTAQMKWLNYKLLTMATRAIMQPETFLQQYKQRRLEAEEVLQKLEDGATSDDVGTVRDIRSLLLERAEDDRLAIDDTPHCHQWEWPKCNLTVTKAANSARTEEECASLEHSSEIPGSCEWKPPGPGSRPGRCACYGCNLTLPVADGFALPSGYNGVKYGTDAKYQCENDPQFAACAWDGYSCVSKVPRSHPEVLNSSNYSYRFQQMEALTRALHDAAADRLKSKATWAAALSRAAGISTAVVAGVVLTSTPVAIWVYRSTWLHSPIVLTGMVLSTWAMLAWGMAAAFRSMTDFKDLQEAKYFLLEHAWDIVHLDVVLTASTLRFVASANASQWVLRNETGPDQVVGFDMWYQEYRRAENLLREAIEAGQTKATGDTYKVLSNLDGYRRILRDVETMAFCGCEPPDIMAPLTNDTSFGVKVLYSQTYLAAKDMYSSEIQVFMRRCEVETFQALASGRTTFKQESWFTCLCIMLLPWQAWKLASVERKCHQLMKEKKDRQKELVRLAEKSSTAFLFPMVVIKAPEFMTWQLLQCHESLRDKGTLVYKDTTECMDRWVAETNAAVVFFSHQWLSCAHPDPMGIQIADMKLALEDICVDEGVSMEHLYVWVDYSSVPQACSETQQAAIMSLPRYVQSAKHFVAISPDALHEVTNEYCNAETYERRMWCRLEIFSFLLASEHPEKMRMVPAAPRRRARPRKSTTVFDASRRITNGNVPAYIFVFEGECTCCSMGHASGSRCDKQAIVPTVLGLYMTLLSRARKCGETSSAAEMLEHIQNHKARIFPPTVEYQGEDVHEKKELFGDLIQQLEDWISSGEVKLKCVPTSDFTSSSSSEPLNRQSSQRTDSTATAEEDRCVEMYV